MAMATRNRSRYRRVEIGLFLLTIVFVIGFGHWWRKREWNRYVAEASASGRSANSSHASVDELVAQFADPSSIARYEAVELLVAKGTDAVEPLIKALGSTDSQTRKHAVLA